MFGIIGPCVTDIFNTTLLKGVVPSSFKTAVVAPILIKLGLDPAIPKIYSPISKLPLLSKILVKTVVEQLFSHTSDTDSAMSLVHHSKQLIKNSLFHLCNISELKPLVSEVEWR